MAGIDRTGKDSVMMGWDTYIARYPIWSLHEYSGKKIGLAKFTGGPEDRQLFLDMLTAAEQSGTQQGYCICFWNETESGDQPKGAEPPGSFTFNLKPIYGAVARMGGVGESAAMAPTHGPEFIAYLYGQIAKLESKCEILEDEKNELENELRQIETEQETAHQGQNLGTLGKIGEAFKEYPELKSLAQDGIYMLRKLFEKRTDAPPVALAGLPSDAAPGARYDAAVETLLNFYVTQANDKNVGFNNFANDMELLAKMTSSPLDFNYAISKLRENFKK